MHETYKRRRHLGASREHTLYCDSGISATFRIEGHVTDFSKEDFSHPPTDS